MTEIFKSGRIQQIKLTSRYLLYTLLTRGQARLKWFRTIESTCLNITGILSRKMNDFKYLLLVNLERRVGYHRTQATDSSIFFSFHRLQSFNYDRTFPLQGSEKETAETWSPVTTLPPLQHILLTWLTSSPHSNAQVKWEYDKITIQINCVWCIDVHKRTP